ncbi:hypothetical protein FISHEDRAFT_59089 [Fistulina hepatica ATCC 64428]|uniref:Uncharacterized protein n=1 Tax=Fistulina hepatica ATCC 64428 TaxID=1128425 RepID=A0A0D7ABA2_9AGAR|nr:hypothetical protein FISHEDRAFT_59089 [Fistulina hepatica ATCC 64428]
MLRLSFVSFTVVFLLFFALATSALPVKGLKQFNMRRGVPTAVKRATPGPSHVPRDSVPLLVVMSDCLMMVHSKSRQRIDLSRHSLAWQPTIPKSFTAAVTFRGRYVILHTDQVVDSIFVWNILDTFAFLSSAWRGH